MKDYKKNGKQIMEGHPGRKTGSSNARLQMMHVLQAVDGCKNLENCRSVWVEENFLGCPSGTILPKKRQIITRN